MLIHVYIRLLRRDVLYVALEHAGTLSVPTFSCPRCSMRYEALPELAGCWPTSPTLGTGMWYHQDVFRSFRLLGNGGAGVSAHHFIESLAGMVEGLLPAEAAPLNPAGFMEAYRYVGG